MKLDDVNRDQWTEEKCKRDASRGAQDSISNSRNNVRYRNRRPTYEQPNLTPLNTGRHEGSLWIEKNFVNKDVTYPNIKGISSVIITILDRSTVTKSIVQRTPAKK
ncbi:hypothetical protein M5689_019987 [Euphorbia peplus]|nr:hypothetical protein M5689_019987 [Euphorbia peplus]